MIILHLPVVCKIGDEYIKYKKIELLIEIHCRWCDKLFRICRCCWRGQSYCSDKCRKAAQKKAHQESQKRYRKTEKGKRTHREAEKRRRMGLTKKNKKTVGDEGTTIKHCGFTMTAAVQLSDQEKIDYAGTTLVRIGHCNFCGCLGVMVDRFPRRGYGKREYTTKMLWQWIISGEIRIANDRANRNFKY